MSKHSRRSRRNAGDSASGKGQRQAWLLVLEKVNIRLVDLRQQSYYFKELAKIAESVKEFKGHYVMDIPRWFAAFAVMAIRRELDMSPDCHSLRRVIEEMARSREPVLDFRGTPVNLVELRNFRKRLSELSVKVEHIADKEVAHATIAGADETKRPTYPELFACIEEFESIAVRYRGYLSGEALLTRDDSSAIPVRTTGSSQMAGPAG